MNSSFVVIVKICCILLLCSVSALYGQSKSRVIGTIDDSRTGEPLIGANILLIDTHLGAVTDVNGKFTVIAVPVGTYKVQVSMVGYGKKVVTGVVVIADQVAEVKVALDPGDIEMNTVVVTAQRDALHKEVSNTQLAVDAEQITEAAGIQQINQFLMKQPGVDESNNGFLTIRGGAADQTGTMVNGISYNNAAIGNAETTIPLSAIEQVSVLSGGFNAEYGNFRSGLINVTTKSGTKEGYHGTFSYQHNFDHLKRFGPDFTDPKAPMLAPYLDPTIAFAGTNAASTYDQGQMKSFVGWVKAADDWNKANPSLPPVQPGDLYLLANWMFMTVPDYAVAQKWGISDSLPSQIQDRLRLFQQHARKETGSDYNFDGGFGGPLPGLGGIGGTFYVSNNSNQQAYTVPVAVSSQKMSTTLATVRTEPSSGTTLTLNGMWKYQEGLSPIRPGMEGDFPDASHDGDFMQVDNIRNVVRSSPSSEFGNYYFDQAFFPLLIQRTFLSGLTINHVVNNSTYWEFGANYLAIHDETPQYGDSRDTTVLTNFGPIYVDEMPYGKWQFAGSHKHDGYTFPAYDALPDVSTFRFRGKEGDLVDHINIRQLRLKYDIASQFNEMNYFKAGIEYNRINIDHIFWERWNNNAYNVIELNYQRAPSQTGAYMQDQLTYQWMLANIGLRFDYYYGGGGVWPSGDPYAWSALKIDPSTADSSRTVDQVYNYLENGGSFMWDLWNRYDAAHPGFLQPVKNFFTVSPRVGVSFPLTENSKFYFNFGHFRSNPPYYSMYLVKYRYKDGLKEMPNPNMEPPRTIQYELGTAYNFVTSYILRASLYYKDVTGQNGAIAYSDPNSGTSYSSYLGNQYQDIQGMELSLSKQDNSWMTGDITFDYRLSKTGYTSLATFVDAPVTDSSTLRYANPESRSLPRPNVTATVSFRTSGENTVSGLSALFNGWRITFFGQWQAGSYFTWNPLSDPTVENNLQWPDYWALDVKMNKSFTLMGLQTTLAVEVKNLLNLKQNIMSGKYCFDGTSGSTDYSDYLASLHLPMYADPRFDALRTSTQYIAGNDKPGDLRSADKPYINDPNYSYFEFDNPRDIWITMKVDF